VRLNFVLPVSVRIGAIESIVAINGLKSSLIVRIASFHVASPMAPKALSLCHHYIAILQSQKVAEEHRQDSSGSICLCHCVDLVVPIPGKT